MKFGIYTALEYVGFDVVRDWWRTADELDVYDYAFVNDHLQPVRGDWAGPNLESWVSLTALTAATSRIRVGSLVNAAPYRHPGLLAKMAVTLDIISGGRSELSVGAGWATTECDAYGIELLSMRERFDRFEEYLQVLISLLSEPRTTFQGRYYRLTDAVAEPTPLQRPRPPIVIGGRGQTRTLQIVARYGDHWNYPVYTASVEEWQRLRDRLYGFCAEIGRDPATITKSVSLGTLWSDPPALADLAATWADAGVDAGLIQVDQPCTPDDLAAAADALKPMAL